MMLPNMPMSPISQQQQLQLLLAQRALQQQALAGGGGGGGGGGGAPLPKSPVPLPPGRKPLPIVLPGPVREPPPPTPMPPTGPQVGGGGGAGGSGGPGTGAAPPIPPNSHVIFPHPVGPMPPPDLPPRDRNPPPGDGGLPYFPTPPPDVPPISSSPPTAPPGSGLPSYDPDSILGGGGWLNQGSMAQQLYAGQKLSHNALNGLLGHYVPGTPAQQTPTGSKPAIPGHWNEPPVIPSGNGALPYYGGMPWGMEAGDMRSVMMDQLRRALQQRADPSQLPPKPPKPDGK